MSTTLGLDLGPNSIGWALVNSDQQQLLASGVRIFPEGVDNFDSAKEKSRNEDRRTARGMRRQVQRRARRKRILQSALIEAGLWPAEAAAQQALLALDPFALRARAVDPLGPPLAAHELGRVLLHLNQRRGFLSNRKADAKDKEAEGMKAEIGSLQHELDTRGLTLGAYLNEKVHVPPAERGEENRVRRRHTARIMLEHELLCIAERHPALLPPPLLFGRHGGKPLKARKALDRNKGETLLQAFGIHGLIFFQRALYWPKSMIGLCELEPLPQGRSAGTAFPPAAGSEQPQIHRYQYQH